MKPKTLSVSDCAPGMKLVNPQMTSTVAASARWYSRPSAFSPLERKGGQRQEDGVGGGVPPQVHAQRHDALRHELHAKVGPVKHEIERHECEAPEQELAFHDPHALEVGFDGLLPVEEEPCGDGEEDDHAHLAAALHHELEEDPLRLQGEFQHVVAVMDDEVMGEDHEHRDDAQQLDAGIPLPPPI